MNKILDIADVVELRTWANDKPYSVSALKEELEASLSGDDAGDAEDYALKVFEELERRATLLGKSYPFTVDGITLSPNEQKHNSSYLFCLGLKFMKDIPDNLRTREFEAIVKSAAEDYFRGKAVRIGAPWKTGEITDYRQLLQLVSDLIPDLGEPMRETAPDGGDGGWDVVVVNNFADQQFSRIIALGNCATGKTDWLKKGQETSPALFWSFFSRSPTERNVCLTFLAVPFLMTEGDKLRKLYHGSISFDRIRLCERVPSTTDAVMQWLDDHKTEALGVSLI
ncbi:MAG TPA: hypothetical protein VN937_21975 [Blastocatellia bacterium]|nr:hypothetical protein [Blastocatellia bacterium]